MPATVETNIVSSMKFTAIALVISGIEATGSTFEDMSAARAGEAAARSTAARRARANRGIAGSERAGRGNLVVRTYVRFHDRLGSPPTLRARRRRRRPGGAAAGAGRAGA